MDKINIEKYEKLVKINIEKYEKLVKILEEYPSLHTEFEDSQCSHIKKFVNDLASYQTVRENPRF